MGANIQEKVVFSQPKTIAERAHVAESFCSKLKISIPCLLDGLDDKVNQAYSAWPDRLYLIGTDGKIIFQGGPGPRGFKPAELMAKLDKYLPTLKSTSDSSRRE